MRKYHTNAVRIVLSIAAAYLMPVVGYAQDLSCQATCGASINSPYCLKLTANSGHGDAFAKLYGKVASNSNRIDSNVLLSLFDIASDPCNRSDTIINNGVLSNSGNACRISADVTIISNVSVRLKVDVPSRTEMRMYQQGTTYTFRAVSGVAVLSVDDEDLQKDWGGSIREVIAKQDRIWFQVPNGCIQIPYE